MSVIQTSTKRSVAAPMFTPFAKAIVRSYGAWDRASDKFSAELSRTMNQYVDACRIAPDMAKDKESCDAIAKAIRTAEPFERAVRDGLLQPKTIAEYANGAARAYFHGVEWTPRLKNDPDKGLPWGKAKGSKGTKAGAVTSTSRADLDQTIQKALAQARLLTLHGLAAALLDVAVEHLEGFEEKTAQ